MSREIPELIQLMRCCNMHQVMQELERLKENYPATYEEVERFYEGASQQPKAPPHPSRGTAPEETL